MTINPSGSGAILDTCQYRTILHADPPRSQCPTHGVRVVKLPWAEPSSRFTALFESLAIAWLKAASQKAVADQLGLSWDEIHGIMERAVKRGLQILNFINNATVAVVMVISCR